MLSIILPLDLLYSHLASNQARKNASLFLGTTIHFRAILEAFDEQVCVVMPMACDILRLESQSGLSTYAVSLSLLYPAAQKCTNKQSIF